MAQIQAMGSSREICVTAAYELLCFSAALCASRSQKQWISCVVMEGGTKLSCTLNMQLSLVPNHLTNLRPSCTLRCVREEDAAPQELLGIGALYKSAQEA